MSLFVTKTLLAVLFVAAGLTAALSMLTLMGKAERKMGVMALRNTHRVAGYTFAALLVVLAILGLQYLSSAGDTLSVVNSPALVADRTFSTTRARGTVARFAR